MRTTRPRWRPGTSPRSQLECGTVSAVKGGHRDRDPARNVPRCRAEQRPGSGDIGRGDTARAEVAHPRIPARAPRAQGIQALAPVHVGIRHHRVVRPERPGRPGDERGNDPTALTSATTQQHGRDRPGDPARPGAYCSATSQRPPPPRPARCPRRPPTGRTQEAGSAAPLVLGHGQREGGKQRRAGTPTATPAPAAQVPRQAIGIRWLRR